MICRHIHDEKHPGNQYAHLLLGKRIEQTYKHPESNQKQKVQRQAPAKSLQNAVIHMNVGRKNKVSMIVLPQCSDCG